MRRRLKFHLHSLVAGIWLNPQTATIEWGATPVIRKLIAMLALSALSGGTAAAGPIDTATFSTGQFAWFYNRPGVAVADMEADLEACGQFGTRLASRFISVSTGAVASMAEDWAADYLAVMYVDECMMSLGYRRFNIRDESPPSFRRRFQEMPPEMQSPYIGAETPPEGELARRWVNSYWLPAEGEQTGSDTRRFMPRAPRASALRSKARFVRSRAISGPLTLNPGEAVVVMSLRSPSGVGAYVQFERQDPETGEAGLLYVDNRARWPGFEARVPFSQTHASRFAFIVPEGVYVLGQVQVGSEGATSFCLGTAAFQVQAGDVVDLGDYVVQRWSRRVDQHTPAPNVRMRIDQPEITAERALTLIGAQAQATPIPARYFNRFPRVCPGHFLPGAHHIYGFEIPGAAEWVGSAPREAAE